MNEISLKQIIAEISAIDEDNDPIFESIEETFNRVLAENYWPEDDKGNQQKLSDTRRPRLTLRHLNKLRKIQELKKLDQLAHADFVRTMYANPEEEGGEF